MRLLLDTQSFLWAVDAPPKLSERARNAIRSDRNEVLVSAVTAWEIAIKSQLGDLRLPQQPARFVPEQMAANSFAPLAVLIDHALKVADLPPIHRDPFDRLLVAQAMTEGLTLVTADRQLSRYDVQTLW